MRRGIALILLLIFAGVLIHESLSYDHAAYFSDVEVETELSETDSGEDSQGKHIHLQSFNALGQTSSAFLLDLSGFVKEPTHPQVFTNRARLLALLGRWEKDS